MSLKNIEITCHACFSSGKALQKYKNNYCLPLFYTAAFLLFVFSFASCSSSNNCVSNENYVIEYYSGGGFTGFEQGLTVNCIGWLRHWEKKLNSSRQITDSLKLSDEQITKLNDLINSPELFSYSNKYSGNYTAYLSLIKDEKQNTISFNPAELPQDMPAAITNLITELKKLK